MTEITGEGVVSGISISEDGDLKDLEAPQAYSQGQEGC